jgi:hypothetical protein
MSNQTAAQLAAAKAKAQKAKAAKFVELAEKRVTRAINAIRSISKLSNKNSYVYTDAQSKKICEALREEVLSVNEHFTAKTTVAKQGFKL